MMAVRLACTCLDMYMPIAALADLYRARKIA